MRAPSFHNCLDGMRWGEETRSLFVGAFISRKRRLVSSAWDVELIGSIEESNTRTSKRNEIGLKMG